ncbi:cytoskeletal protein binding protein, partial [Basidiobolus ranarum]
MAYVNVCRAIYDYTAQDDEELSFQENDVLYIKDTSDPEWWIAQEKSPIMEEEGRKGLIPSTYVEELPYIEVVKTVYDYEARTEEELSFGENEIMYVIEKDDPDWALVKLGDKFGFVPSAYLEPAEDGDSQPHELEDSHQGDYHEDAPQPLPPKPIQQTPAEPVKEAARPASLAIAEDMEYWSVSEVDKKKKKKKGKLGISSQAIFFFSETDKTPVRKWSFNDVLNFSCKTKHVYIEFGGADAVSFDFHAGSKSEAEKISKKLTECKAKFFTVAAAPIPQVQEFVAPPPPPAVQNSFAQDAPPEQASSHQNDQYEDPQYQDQYQTSNLEQSEAVDELPEPKLAIALYDFEPQNDDELDLRADEQVWVVDDFSSDEWWRCKIVDEQGNEREGVVPASYLQLDDGYPYDDQQYEQDEYNQQEYEQQQYVDDQQEAYEEKPPLPPMPVQKTADEDIPPPLPPVPIQRFADENTPPPLPPTPTQKYVNDSNPPPLPPLPNARSAPSPTQPDAPPLPPKNASIDPKVKPLPEMPPPLAARPSMQSRKSTDDIPLQMIVNANQTSQPKPRSQSSSKPRPSQVRVWSDRSGSFKVEAEFLGLKDGKIHLHKLNGVKIAVPLEKMSVDDLYFIEEFTGKEVPAAAYEGKITVPKRTSSNQSQFDWRAYFIKAGISTEAASKYSSTFNSERMDMSILPDLNREILKDLHIAEGDIIRILKAVKSMDNSPTSRLKPKRSVSFGETSVIPHPETDHDEELARKIQEEEVHQMRDGSARSQNRLQIEKDEQLARELQARENGAARPAQQPLGLNLSGSSGHKLTRKSTRPTPSKPAPSAITAESVANAQEKLKKATTSQGFDDDAWGPNGSIINPEPPKKEPTKMVAQPVVHSTPIPTTGAFSLETTATPSSPALKSTSSNFTSTWSSAPNSAAMVASPIQKSTPIINSQPFVQQNNFQQSPQVVSPQNNFQQSPQVV